MTATDSPRIVRPDPARAAPVRMDGVKEARMEILVGREHGAPNFAMRHFVGAPGGRVFRCWRKP